MKSTIARYVTLGLGTQDNSSIIYSLTSVGIVNESISDHNDTNKRFNCLNLICALIQTIG